MRRQVRSYTAILLCTLLSIGSCGIYTTRRPLNPPFALTLGTDSLAFSGFNTEPYCLGYIIWYKEAQDDYYKSCAYPTPSNFPRPTLPRTSATQVEDYAVDLNFLFPDDEVKSFDELNTNDPKRKFYFAVSAYGEEGEESERVEFGIWPN
jgi:hypothetical protein